MRVVTAFEMGQRKFSSEHDLRLFTVTDSLVLRLHWHLAISKPVN